MSSVRVENKIDSELFELTEPVVLRGVANQWPAVKAGRESFEQLRGYLLNFDAARPLTVYEGSAEICGRYFYNDDFSGFNFSRTRMLLEEVISKIADAQAMPSPNSYYVGSTMINHWLPGFELENKLDLEGREHLNSIWIGNQSIIAPHFDFPSNIACVVSGRRRFTLFPPDQGANLYVGPFDHTPSGQPISLVDLGAPDYEKFPKYRVAEESAIIVELAAGDALFIPSMWWHSVEALSDFNVLVNYWWRSTPAYLGSPLAALHHALLSFHDLPKEQLDAWQALFARFVFSREDDALNHIPEHARGILADIDETMARNIKQNLSKSLKG